MEKNIFCVGIISVLNDEKNKEYIIKCKNKILNSPHLYNHYLKFKNACNAYKKLFQLYSKYFLIENEDYTRYVEMLLYDENKIHKKYLKKFCNYHPKLIEQNSYYINKIISKLPCSKNIIARKIFYILK